MPCRSRRTKKSRKGMGPLSLIAVVFALMLILWGFMNLTHVSNPYGMPGQFMGIVQITMGAIVLMVRFNH